MIYRLIACAMIGIISHGILTIELHDRWEDEESLTPAVLAFVFAVVIEVIAWEIIGLFGRG